ncbi:MAG: ABC transporter permease [Candidatus Dormibacteraeota bacterium]|nr:ABC transporter permease [Candidatus Dormibacteraeota bacterium]
MTRTAGAAAGIARARESGLLPRLALVPKPAWRVVGGWAAGSALVDAVQLAPALAVLIVMAPVTPAAGLALVVDVVAVLMLANALGCAVAAVGAGPGEVLLDTTVILAPLLFLGGLFTGVPRDGWRWVAATVDPFSYLHAAFIGALGGDPAFTAPVVAVAGAATACAAAVLVAIVSPAVLRSR